MNGFNYNVCNTRPIQCRKSKRYAREISIPKPRTLCPCPSPPPQAGQLNCRICALFYVGMQLLHIKCMCYILLPPLKETSSFLSDGLKMAGECLSYGAFGAYSTNYNRYRGDSVRGSLPNFSGRRVDSWKNFLPIVKQTHSPLYCDKLVPSAEEYDHAEHAGIKGSVYLFDMSRHHLLHLASFGE